MAATILARSQHSLRMFLCASFYDLRASENCSKVSALSRMECIRMYAVAWLKMLSLFTLKVWQEIWSHFIPLFLIFTSKITLFSLITKEMVLKTSHFLLSN